MPTMKGFEVVRRAVGPTEVHRGGPLLRGFDPRGSLGAIGAKAPNAAANVAAEEAFRAKYAAWLPRCGVEGSAVFWSLSIAEREAKLQLCIANLNSKSMLEDAERKAREAAAAADADARRKAEAEAAAARAAAEEAERRRLAAAKNVDEQDTTGSAGGSTLKTVLLVGGGLAALGLGFVLTRKPRTPAPMLNGVPWRSRRRRRR